MNRTLENGHIDGNGSTSGAVYSFLCDEGYSIDGETSLRCDEKGQWNGSIPVCLKGTLNSQVTVWLQFASADVLCISALL